MKEEIEVKIKEMYDYLMEKPRIIYNVFKDFYGESLVDMQNYPSYEEYKAFICINNSEESILTLNNFEGSIKFENIFILVRFPTIRVTNENDKYIDIWELYAKVTFDFQGKIRGSFKFIRAEYDTIQLANDYMHSHISGIPNDSSEFRSPCLGSGPIRNTIASLSADFDELRWQLFCFELNKYVQVESLSGVPYKRLEVVGMVNLGYGENSWKMLDGNNPINYLGMHNFIKDFIKWLINQKKLKFNFKGSFGIGMSYIEWRVFISNAFIEWYNVQFSEKKIKTTYRELLSSGFLKRGIIKNNMIRYEKSRVYDYSNKVGEYVCTFKNLPVLFKIRDLNNSNDNMSTFLNSSVSEYIYKCILETVNYNYGNSNTETQTAGVNQTTFYL